MGRSEYVRIKLLDIPQEFIEEYDLTQAVQNGWIYFEILRGCYGLPQSGPLNNDLLCTSLEQHLVSRAKSGAPFNLFYSLMTSASNMWEKNAPSISSRL